MTLVRRSLQVGALVGTLIVATVALALITTQTPWFKDWLRRFVVRQSKQYLNGELFIGRLGGNLFTGVELAEVSVQKYALQPAGSSTSTTRIAPPAGRQVARNVLYRLTASSPYRSNVSVDQPRRWPARLARSITPGS